VLSGDEHVTEFRPPANVVPAEGQLTDLLAAGELAAVIGAPWDDPAAAPLIPNPEEAGFAALRERGHHPINHLVVVRDDLLAEHPDLAVDVFGAFAEAKAGYVDRLRAGQVTNPTKADQVNQRVMEITGSDPMPYGIEPNRQVIEELVEHALRQHILSERPVIEDLFAPGTRDIIG
jgi:4,5-dihydroxyphthalate decarboxylase